MTPRRRFRLHGFAAMQAGQDQAVAGRKTEVAKTKDFNLVEESDHIPGPCLTVRKDEPDDPSVVLCATPLCPAGHLPLGGGRLDVTPYRSQQSTHRI